MLVWQPTQIQEVLPTRGMTPSDSHRGPPDINPKTPKLE
jgi:hypothetical protein